LHSQTPPLSFFLSYVCVANCREKRTEIVTEGKRLIEGIWFETTFLLESVLVRSLRQNLKESGQNSLLNARNGQVRVLESINKKLFTI